jgi:hypothetical protein
VGLLVAAAGQSLGDREGEHLAVRQVDQQRARLQVQVRLHLVEDVTGLITEPGPDEDVGDGLQCPAAVHVNAVLFQPGLELGE